MIKVKEYIKNVYNLMRKREMLTLPSSLSYYFVLSIVPIISLILLIATNFNISTNYITNFFQKNFSSELVSFLTPLMTKQNITVGFLVHTLVAFYIVSNGADAIIVASNMVFNTENKNFFKRRIKAFLLTIALVTLLTFMLVVPVFGKQLINIMIKLGTKGNFIKVLGTIYPIVRLPLSLIVIYIGVKFIYCLAPDMKIKSNYAIKGSIFTTVGWVIVTFAFSYYARNIATYNIYYAGLSSIVLLMIWFYFLAFIFVLGLSMNYQNASQENEKSNTAILKELEEKVKINKISNQN